MHNVGGVVPTSTVCMYSDEVYATYICGICRCALAVVCTHTIMYQYIGTRRVWHINLMLWSFASLCISLLKVRSIIAFRGQQAVWGQQALFGANKLFVANKLFGVNKLFGINKLFGKPFKGTVS